MNMNELSQVGKKRTILISISVLLVSLFTIYSYQKYVPYIENKKIIQQIIRFIFTAILLYFIYKGKDTARKIAVALFTIAVIAAAYNFMVLDVAIIAKSPLISMIFVYSFAIYHFAFSKSYKEFLNYKKSKKDE